MPEGPESSVGKGEVLLFLPIEKPLEKRFSLVVVITGCLLFTLLHSFAYFLGLDPLMVFLYFLLLRSFIPPLFFPFFPVFLALFALAFHRLVFFGRIATPATVLGHSEVIGASHKQPQQAYF